MTAARARRLAVHFLDRWLEHCGAAELCYARRRESWFCLEFEAEGFDDEVMVFALGQAGDGDAADNAGAGDVDGEAASVGGVVGFGEVVAFAEGAVALLEREADGVGAAVKAGDDVRFALNPARLSGVVPAKAV